MRSHWNTLRSCLSAIVLATSMLVGGISPSEAAVSVSQQNCFNNTGPAYAQWAVYKPYNFAPGTYCIHGITTGALRLVWQADGNLVYYDNNHVEWASNTYNRGATRLALQTDGNVVIYAGTTVLWASNHFACSPTNSSVFRLSLQKESSPGLIVDAIHEQQFSPSGTVWDFQIGNPGTPDCHSGV
jgi:hypothetical protein